LRLPMKSLSRCFSTMTVGTADLTLANFFHQRSGRHSSVRGSNRDVERFHASDMIEIQNDRILLTAINASVGH